MAPQGLHKTVLHTHTPTHTPPIPACGVLFPLRRHVVRMQPCRASSEGGQQQQTATATPAGPVEYVQDSEFNISKISFGSILTPVGLGLMVYGFGAYFTLLPGTDISSILLIYGFPISILGFALSYAQLPPVPCKTTKAAFDLRASQMTDIQKQVREDTTRYRCVRVRVCVGGWGGAGAVGAVVWQVQGRGGGSSSDRSSVGSSAVVAAAGAAVAGAVRSSGR